jgi:glycosyltransferase involved in cell wall biosynthesis
MEAMACGTPVVAFRRGAFPEIVVDKETGFVVETGDEMAAAVEKVGNISPDACRMHVETRFNSARMGREYEALYRVVSSASRQQAA